MAKKSSPKPQPVTQSAIRLEKALPMREFVKHIKHIPSHDLLPLSFSSLTRLLVSKNLVSTLELQQAMLDEVEIKGF